MPRKHPRISNNPVRVGPHQCIGAAVPGLKLTADVYALDGAILCNRMYTINTAANDMTALPPRQTRSLAEQRGMLLITLRLRDLQGKL
jgi:hypothetical protein